MVETVAAPYALPHQQIKLDAGQGYDPRTSDSESDVIPNSPTGSAYCKTRPRLHPTALIKRNHRGAFIEGQQFVLSPVHSLQPSLGSQGFDHVVGGFR